MPIEPEESQANLRGVLRLVASALIETHAMHLVLLELKVLSPGQMDRAREKVRLKLQPLLDNLDETTPADLQELLRKFEGPMQ